MPVKSGVHVWLEVDDKPLEEFKVTAETEQRIQCYVPSQEGKRFTVKFQPEDVTYALRGYVYLDGVFAASQICRKPRVCTILGGQTHLEDHVAPFLFSRLRTTDNEDEACQDESRIRELGSVRFQMEWVDILGEVPFRPGGGLPQTITQPIWEKAKKGASAGHSVAFGNIESVGQQRYSSTRRIPYIPVIDFIFRYGPIDWLRAEGIAPPLPPPPPPRKTGHERVIENTEKENDNKSSSSITTVNGQKLPIIGDSEHSDIDALSPEEEAEYRRLKAKMKAQKRSGPADTNVRDDLRSPLSKRRKSTLKLEPDEDRKPLFPIVRQGDQEYIDLTVDD